VKTQIVGHSVAHGMPSGMTFYYRPGGIYEADDGRNGRSGKYVVKPDGNLCWTESTGIAGCFQYYRVGAGLHLRRTDPDHKFDLGPAKVGPL
jgi:hypothetical protein